MDHLCTCVFTLVQFTGCVLYLDSHFGILLFLFGHEVKYSVVLLLSSVEINSLCNKELHLCNGTVYICVVCLYKVVL